MVGCWQEQQRAEMLTHQREEVQMQSEAMQKELDVLLTQKRLKEELETEAKVSVLCGSPSVMFCSSLSWWLDCHRRNCRLSCLRLVQLSRAATRRLVWPRARCCVHNKCASYDDEFGLLVGQ